MPEGDKPGDHTKAPLHEPQSRPQSKRRSANFQGSQRRHRAAVIDLGTNNCRLLIAEDRPGPKKESRGRRSGEFFIIDSFSRIVRLGEGLSQSGNLKPEAMDRTVAALQVCAGKIKRAGARDVRAVATQACRQAGNGPEFLQRVRAETGLHFRTLNPLQEVQLGVASTLPLLQRRWPHALIFDVGGGSTEISFLTFRKGQGFQLSGSISVPVGVVSLSEDMGSPGDDLQREAYDRMRRHVADAFADFARDHDIANLQAAGHIQTVGMSGTVTTVRALDLGLAHYERRKVDRSLFDILHSDIVLIIQPRPRLARNGP